jgi:hypothetical protein
MTLTSCARRGRSDHPNENSEYGITDFAGEHEALESAARRLGYPTT